MSGLVVAEIDQKLFVYHSFVASFDGFEVLKVKAKFLPIAIEKFF